MKFIAGLRVWVTGGTGKTPQVFPRFRGSKNRRVDLHLPLIASIGEWREKSGQRQAGGDFDAPPGKAAYGRRRLALSRAGLDNQLENAAGSAPLVNLGDRGNPHTALQTATAGNRLVKFP